MVALQAPTPFDPKNWGERVDIKTISQSRIPARGPESWRPLPHDTFVTMIEQAFDRHGFEISEPVHYRAKSRQNVKIKDPSEFGRFLSLYGIGHPGLPDIEGLNWESGFGNSYDMSTAAGGGIGTRLQVCSNGEYMGSMFGFKRKHTVGIDREDTGRFESIYTLVDNCVGGLLTHASSVAQKIHVQTVTECSDVDARWVILEAAKRGVIGAAATMRVLEHWETPEHVEFKDRNVWSLRNSFTSNDRGQSLLTQSDRFKQLSGILDDRFGTAESAESLDSSEETVSMAADF